MTFYKLTFSIFLLIFVACSSIIEMNNSKETNTFVQVSTTTTAMEAGEGIDLGQAFSNFENYWEPLQKKDRPLTDEELNITYALRELMNQEFDYFEGKGGLVVAPGNEINVDEYEESYRITSKTSAKEWKKRILGIDDTDVDGA